MAKKTTKATQSNLEQNRLRYLRYESENLFLFFVMMMFKEHTGFKFIPYPHINKIAAVLQLVAEGRLKRVIINIPPRYGKAICENTDILTDKGFIKAFQVKIGDKFIGSNGKWTNVNAVYPQGITDLYRVTFSDKSYVDTCSEHLWQVKNRDRKHTEIKKTKELIGDLYAGDGRKKWKIPMIDSIKEHNSDDWCDITIDPYLLGCWLGDGSSSSAEITTMDLDIANAFLSVYKKGIRTHQNSGKAETIGLIGGFHVELKELNLIRNKHIPLEYLYGDFKTRLAVLQGLMDTDGTCNKKNGAISFCNKNRNIIDGIKYLISSLGGVYSLYHKNGSINVSFRLPNGLKPFRLQRKLQYIPKHNARLIPRRFIKSITKIENKKTICFEVDAKDKLFTVTRDLILTHNTEIVVKMFIAWGLALNKRAKFIHLSSSSDLALDNSAMAKEYIQSEHFQKLWPMELKIDQQSKSKWFNKDGGGCYATSIGGQIIGFGAGIRTSRKEIEVENKFKAFGGAILIDDPNKPEDSLSDTKREGVNRTYNSTVKTRVNNPSETPIILIQQRLHERDLSGFLLDKGSGEKWFHLSLPVLDEDNNPLCEEIHNIKQIEQMRKADRYTFAGQYMQLPSPDEGGIFLRDWFKKINKAEMPPINSWQLFIDGAYTKNTNNDPTGLMVCAKEGNNLYILSFISKYLEMPELLKYIPQYINSLGVYIDSILIEPKASGLSMAQLLRNQTDYNVIELRGNILRESKIERASKASPYAESGKVHLVEGIWIDGFLHEVCTFPNAVHDEAPDLLSYAIDRELFNRSNAEIIW